MPADHVGYEPVSVKAVLAEMTARCELGETPDCPIVEQLFENATTGDRTF
jgi:hypothetical protein